MLIDAEDVGSVERVAALLKAGEVAAFPTETVYGLGANARDGKAVARIYEAKGRPSFNPLIVHVASLEAAEEIATFDPLSRRFAEAFWPGALTLVLPLKDTAGISSLVTAGLDTIALRVPAHPLARRLIETSGLAIAAPSANRSGRVSPTTAAHVMADLDGRIAAVLDGGSTRIGVESTIVAVTGDDVRLLRHGGVSRGDLEAIAGRPIIADQPVVDDAAPISPGLLTSHYAPKARVRLNADDVRADEAYLGFGPVASEIGSQAAAFESLSERGDPAEAAANLFAALRRLDRPGIAAIAVAPIPQEGLGEAINDRLARAAAPRS
nr:L-threonylcarbamoyladenylate synthase [Hartmannibacter diazotrophicus]